MKKFLIAFGAFLLFLAIYKLPQKATETIKVDEIELVETPFKKLTNWDEDAVEEARKGFLATCDKLKFEKGEFLSNSTIKISVKSYQNACDKLSELKSFRAFLEENFTPYLVVYNGNETGKFTSYYESRINASFTKDNKYKHPIYGKPKDLVEVRLKDFDDTLPNKVIIGRVEKNRLVKYYTRAEIHKNGVDAPVILWADDQVDIYVMQIQGSAIAHLDNGEDIRIGYADNNGRPFSGIGSILLNKKLLAPGKASMGDIKKWLKENEKAALPHMLENERFVFSCIVDAEGPVGAQGVPLRAGRSLAVDKSYVPLGALLWLETTGPDKEKIEKLVVAQDIGSAIKGPIRGDYFWGSGDDEVLDKAGRMNSQGRYFILVPKQ